MGTIALGAGIAGVYVGGTGYFVLNDLDDSPETIGYSGTELVVHGSLAAVFLQPTIRAAREGNLAGATGRKILKLLGDDTIGAA